MANKLLGSNSSYFNYKAIYGHNSYNRHDVYVSSEFINQFIKFVETWYPTCIFEDTPNFDNWKALIDNNGRDANGRFKRFCNTYYYTDVNTGWVLMAPINLISCFLQVKYNLLNENCFNKYTEIVKIVEIISTLRELRVIEVTNQTEYMIFDKSIAKELGTEEAVVVYPTMAYNKFNKLLNSAYSESEKEEAFNAHVLSDDDTSPICHYQISQAVREFEVNHHINSDKVHIVKFDNCYEYDINAAYFSGLIEVFPKLKNKLTDWYNKRHDNDNYFKKVINYTVGCMTINDKKKPFAGEKRLSMVHHETRNWIVNRTSEKLLAAVEKSQGNLLYANTDGFIVQNPINKLENSDKIGEFGLEARGTMYAIVVDKTWDQSPYFAFQFVDELNNRTFIKGNLPVPLRQHLDLARGQYPVFKTRINKYGRAEYESKDIKIGVVNHESSK